MSVLEQNTIRKKYVNRNNPTKLDVNDNHNRNYKLKAIFNNAVYIRESTSYLAKLYNLVFWKNYLKEKNILESRSAI